MITTVDSDCDPAWQWALAYNGSVEFDADIVGPGVIASFIASSLTALVALMFAFMTYSIPTEFLNDIDRAAVRVLRRAFASLRTRLHWPNATETVDDEAREDRLQAFQTFMLSMTDQVLASDLAILIATFARHVDITLYSVDVVIALGCLACTVHLAMVPLLIDHLRKHHVTKVSRSILMLAGAIMLVTLLVLRLSDTWRNNTHIYLRCAVRDLQLDVWYDPIGFATRLLVPVVILLGYCEVTMLLYCSGEDSAPTNWLDRLNRWNAYLPNTSSRSRAQWLQYAPRKAAQNITSLRAQRLYAICYAEVWAFHACQGSFLWTILWLLSANVYGVTSVFVARSKTAGISGDRDQMGYGQIVPLVLLVLPVLAAIQGVYDYYDRIQRKHETRPAANPGQESESNLTQDTHTSCDSLSGMTEVDVPASDETISSATPTAESQLRPSSPTPSHAPQDAPTPTLSPPTLEETIPSIFASSTLPLPEDSSIEAPTEGIDRSLWHWSHGDKEFCQRPFAQGFVYAHTIFMLAFAVAFGWGLAAGPPEAVWSLGAVMLAISARRIAGFAYFAAFARWYRAEIAEMENALGAEADVKGKAGMGMHHNHAVMHAQAINAMDETSGNDEELEFADL